MPAGSGGGSTAGGSGGAAVAVDRISVQDGRLRFEDRSVEPPLVLALENVVFELQPASGKFKAAAGENTPSTMDRLEDEPVLLDCSTSRPSTTEAFIPDT